MQTVLILFGVPSDTDAFDRHLEDNFSPLLRSVPNVGRIAFNHIAGAAHGESPYYLIIELQFDSVEAMQEGLNSQAGQAMAADLSEFSSGGYSLLFAEGRVERFTR